MGGTGKDVSRLILKSQFPMHLLEIDQKRDWYFRNIIPSSNNIPAKKRSKFFPCKDLAPFCFLSKGRLFWKANFAKLEKFSESKSLLLWIARIRGRPLDFLNTCPLQVYFCIISWLQTCYLNKRLQNECIAEKNWRSKVELLDVCFLQKMLSRPKDRSSGRFFRFGGKFELNSRFARKRRISTFLLWRCVSDFLPVNSPGE